MHVRVVFAVVALLGLHTTSPALADFAIRTDLRPLVTADEPPIDRGDRQPGNRGRPRDRPVLANEAPIARGFGDNVPLSFACRQIVPSFVQVSYGPGVEQEASVTWRGGQAWPIVLSAAIRPLGLRLIRAGNRVVIRQ